MLCINVKKVIGQIACWKKCHSNFMLIFEGPAKCEVSWLRKVKVKWNPFKRWIGTDRHHNRNSTFKGRLFQICKKLKNVLYSCILSIQCVSYECRNETLWRSSCNGCQNVYSIRLCKALHKPSMLILLLTGLFCMCGNVWTVLVIQNSYGTRLKKLNYIIFVIFW